MIVVVDSAEGVASVVVGRVEPTRAPGLVVVAGMVTNTVTVTINLCGGAPGSVLAGTCTMITCGGAVSGGVENATGTVLVEVDGRVEVGRTSVVELVVVALLFRPERLISEAVMVAPPMMSAAIIGPNLVRLHHPADRTGVTT